MCGIAGHVTNGALADQVGVRGAMLRLAHRGPDGEGIHALRRACLGHRRLSIIDLVESTQPMVSADGRHTLVFNGEIYNYLELRDELLARGAVFRTHGDTEVLLHMYLHFGEDCLSRLNGMFAFAIWDNQTQTLFAVRDRVGKKPFYYAQNREGLAFASELPAMMAFGWVDRTLNPVAVNRFFAHQYVGGAETTYRGIRQLPAGCCLIYREGEATIRRYWSPPQPESEVRPESALREELQFLLDDAVRLRLRSDVPLGAFLSGGLDSSIIVSSMRRQGGEVHTFCVGFGESSFDETEHAREAAQFFGTSHHASVIDWDLQQSVRSALAHFGEPYADPSAVPTWHLCQYTRSKVTVAVSGDGADELFGGYRRYYARQQLARWLAIPGWARQHVIAPLVRRLPESDRYYAASMVKKLKLFIRLADQLERSPGAVAPQTYSLPERMRLFNAEAVAVKDDDFVTEFKLQSCDPVTQMILTDVRTYLTDDILVKVDRMSMAHGLEARSPFLDYRLVEFACRLPVEWKLRDGQQKYLLRSAFRDRLPPTPLARPKHGFAVPLGAWFRGPLKSLFDEVVLAPTTPDALNRREIESIWLKHQSGQVDNGFKLWSLLAFHYWYHGFNRS